MKTIILLLSLFSLIPFTSNDESFLSVKIKIENSLVKIKTHANRQGQGSGTFIRVKEQDYTLTNAHVCLAGELDNAMAYDIKTQVFKYKIISKDYELETFIPVDDLIYSISEDWCLIPMYSNLSFPIIDQTFLGDEFNGWVRYISYNRQQEMTSYDSFKACSLNNDLDTKLHECRPPVFPRYNMSSIYIASDNKTEKTMLLFEGYNYYLPVIPGDSGSPVFNEKNQLIGLISATGKLRREIPGLATTQITYGVVTPIQGFKDGSR